MVDLDYARPNTLQDALALLQDENALAMAGGQTLMPALRARLTAPSLIVEIWRLSELRGIHVEGDKLIIGAGSRHDEIAGTPVVGTLIPGLADLAGRIGDPQVRNRGTLGGSLANNDPAACYPAAALALNAVIVTDRREIAAADFFTGLFETALAPGELIVSVRFAIPKASAYAKMRHPASRFAMAGVFAARFDNEARLGVTGAGDSGAFRWREGETALKAEFRPEALDGLSLDPAEMLSDHHAQADYRAQLVKVMAQRAVKACG